MTWVYSQSTGSLWSPGGEIVDTCYSGGGEGKNNPALESIPYVGPLPRGLWLMPSYYDSTKIGPFAIVLIPSGHDAHKRTFFRIHGDSISNPGNASSGCLIANRPTRQLIWQSLDRLLKVIE